MDLPGAVVQADLGEVKPLNPVQAGRLKVVVEQVEGDVREAEFKEGRQAVQRLDEGGVDFDLKEMKMKKFCL